MCLFLRPACHLSKFQNRNHYGNFGVEPRKCTSTVIIILKTTSQNPPRSRSGANFNGKSIIAFLTKIKILFQNEVAMPIYYIHSWHNLLTYSGGVVAWISLRNVVIPFEMSTPFEVGGKASFGKNPLLKRKWYWAITHAEYSAFHSLKLQHVSQGCLDFHLQKESQLQCPCLLSWENVFWFLIVVKVRSESSKTPHKVIFSW